MFQLAGIIFTTKTGHNKMVKSETAGKTEFTKPIIIETILDHFKKYKVNDCIGHRLVNMAIQDWLVPTADPRPDYYRKLPSYQETEEGSCCNCLPILWRSTSITGLGWYVPYNKLRYETIQNVMESKEILFPAGHLFILWKNSDLMSIKWLSTTAF